MRQLACVGFTLSVDIFLWEVWASTRGSLDSTFEQMVMCTRGSFYLLVPYLERCGQKTQTHTWQFQIEIE